MKKIIHYLKDYFSTIHLTVFLSASLFTAILIFFNYYFGLNKFLYRLGGPWQYLGWYTVFFVAFSFGYVLQSIFLKSELLKSEKFILLLLIAPAIFACKMTFSFSLDVSTDFFKKEYWNAVVYWPFKVVVLTLALVVVHAFFDKGRPFYGTSARGFFVKPYLIMLLVMVPLIAAASTQKDFLRMYPRLQNVEYLLQPARG